MNRRKNAEGYGEDKIFTFDWQVPLSLLFLVMLVYAVVFPGSFFPDDIPIIKTNPLVADLDLAKIFMTDYWGAGEKSGLYRPLTILSLALNRVLFGSAAWGYLLVNLLLHVAVACLLFVFLVRLQLSRQVAWLGAALFAVHPCHGEAIAVLVGRSELLAAGFGLTALVLLQSDRSSLRSLALGCCVAALLSKEHAVALLAMVPLCDLYSGSTIRATIQRRCWLWCGLLLLTIGWLLWRYYVVQVGGDLQAIIDPYFIPLGGLDTAGRVLAALKMQGMYLWKMLIPVGLLGIYPASVVMPVPGWGSVTGIVVVIILLLGLALLLYGWRKRSFWALALTLYFVNFLPTSQLFFAAEFAMADRMTYMPSLWFSAMLASLVFSLPIHQRKVHALVGCTLLLVFYTSAGVARALDFRTPETLWKSDLRIRPDNELALLMLGDFYLTQKRLPEAEETLRRLAEIAPQFEQGLSLYAGVLVELGKAQEALTVARKAVKLVQGGESFALLPMAAAYNLLGRPGEALKVLQKVPSATAKLETYWEVRGHALELTGDLIGAMQSYQKEQEFGVGRRKDVYRRLGRLHLQLGNPVMAESALRQDVLLNPETAEGWNLLGVALGQLQRREEAGNAFRKAVLLKPEIMEYKANLKRSTQI
ncbi:MAG: tetratricopeptide repeat protein [Desulfuromonadales bacterium]|nr:tetratricopeptide repeat protein [Desulfuromonadales bacterium]